MTRIWYAHSLKNKGQGEWQTLDVHHFGTAEMAVKYAPAWLAGLAALLAGIHDIGKATCGFQKRLSGDAARIDHATAAAFYLLSRWGGTWSGKALARLLAFPLTGHHGGLADMGSPAKKGSLAHRLSDAYRKSLPAWEEPKGEPTPAEAYSANIRHAVTVDGAWDAFATAFLVRMLHSLLIDADWLDTERFCSPARLSARREPLPPSVLRDRFMAHLAAKDFLPKEDALSESGDRAADILRARRFMLGACLERASDAPGFFSLTMPTGGGKTLSSLAFALSHAAQHGMKRVIVVSPYTSIIEQNAAVIRAAVGRDAVLEHHSNYEAPEDGDTTRLLSENWDAGVIVTTSVQFFESLFAGKNARCRKIHNIAESVIILDEVQMLPVPFVAPCLAALGELCRNYDCSVVLCTATQPALFRSSFLPRGINRKKIREIVPEENFPILSRIFSRARTEVRERPVDDAELAGELLSHSQVLCIVNSRLHARDLFLLLGPGEENFHLSARMTPAHRSRVFLRIRERLAKGLPCRVVSTSLVECGVDISFPVVMREKNGLDVLVQSAGRCNREGKEESGLCICFTSSRPATLRASELNRRRAAFDAVAREQDLFSPATIALYFEKLYAKSDLDEENILSLTAIDPKSENLWKFEFAAIAKKFRFIPDDTVSVIVWTGEVENALRKFRKGRKSPVRMLERLQRHTIQVYRKELAAMEAKGRIRYEHGVFPVLVDGYDDTLGALFEVDV